MTYSIREKPALARAVAAGVGALPRRRVAGADLADIAEQFLDKAALAAQRRGLVAFGVNPRDLLHAAAVDLFDVAGGIETDNEDRLAEHLGLGKGILAGDPADIIPFLCIELRRKGRPAQRLGNRIAIVDPGLDRRQQRFIDQVTLVLADTRTTSDGQRGGDKRSDKGRVAHQKTLPIAADGCAALAQAQYDIARSHPSDDAMNRPCVTMTILSSLRRVLSGVAPTGLPGQALYNRAVDLARRPDWYLAGAAPDTMDGRFDMVALVLSLVLIRLEDDNTDAARQLSADLADRFIADMDGSLRQDGIGDQVVGKHIGRMMAALGGRLGAYRDARHDDAAMATALRKNLWKGEPVDDAAVAWVIAEVRRVADRLATTPYASVAAGTLA